MHLVSYYREGEVRLGALRDGQVVDLQRAHRLLHQRRPDRSGPAALPSTMADFLEAGSTLLGPAQDAVDLAAQLSESEGPEVLRSCGAADAAEEVTLKASVPEPRKIICLGLNYRDHAQESGNPIPDVPVLFTKYPNTLIGPTEPIVIPRVSEEVDFEAELAFVIGRRGRYVRAGEAMAYVAGYAVFKDVSARDFQLRTSHSGRWARPSTPSAPWAR